MYCIENKHLTKEDLFEEFRGLILASIYPPSCDWGGLLVDIFCDSKKEIKKIFNSIIACFNSDLYEILQEYYEFGEFGPEQLDDLILEESIGIELADVEAEDIFTKKELKTLATRVYLDLLNGDNECFTRLLTEELNESNQNLSDQNAFTFLNLLSFTSAEEYFYWFHEVDIRFLTTLQIMSYTQEKC